MGLASCMKQSITSSIQPDGMALFPQSDDPKPVRTFHAELELASQGYTEGSYDMIIAFWVMHATKNLWVCSCVPAGVDSGSLNLYRESSLRDLRKLWKPGGCLMMAEGSYTGCGTDGGLTFIFETLKRWCLGADQGRMLNPYLFTQEWDEVLKAGRLRESI